MKDLAKKFITLIISCCIIVNLPLAGLGIAAGDTTLAGPSLQIKHSPLKSVKAGSIIPISAKVEDREGIELVRIYFRSVGSTPYYFVPMIVSNGSEYYGILPAPSGTTKEIEYLFLVKTYNNRIFNSQTFRSTISEPGKERSDSKQETVDVLVETKAVPKKIVGFDKKTRIRLVTKEEKHGVAAGLYDLENTGGTTTSGQYHGPIVAAKDSNINTMVIVGGVAAGAIAIGLIAGSSSSGGGSPSLPDPIDPTLPTGAGIWTLNFDYPPCTKTTTQTVECSTEGLVTAISPTAVGVPLPEECTNSPYNGLSAVFIVGGSCDTVTACNSYSSPELVSKSCTDNSIIFTKEEGARVETWSVQ